MTTINNLTIEQMREIVSGAPEGATTYCMAYAAYGATFHWYGACKNCYELPDLRTAIAEHDSREFKAGDLVVIKANPFWPEDYFIQQVEPENIGKWYMNAWRHATPSEIKAGHRLETERHG